jgi:RNase P protein component
MPSMLTERPAARVSAGCATGKRFCLDGQRPFHGATEIGVTFGMKAEQVRNLRRRRATRLARRRHETDLASRGVVIWFHDDKVYQIVIFRPQPAGLNRS